MPLFFILGVAAIFGLTGVKAVEQGGLKKAETEIVAPAVVAELTTRADAN